MDENPPIKPCLKKQIAQAVRRTGFDQDFITAMHFHLQILSEEFIPEFITTDDYCNLLMSEHFLKYRNEYPTRRFKCQINEYSGWPLPILPSELFDEKRLSDDSWKKTFYSCLQVGDILHCRVSTVLPTEYHLRVIHKHGVTRILDDLNIIAVMPRNQAVLLSLQKDLILYELVRVAVSSIDKYENETRVYVTVDDKSWEDRPYKLPLGRITDGLLPAYVLEHPDFPPGTTYAKYLSSLSAFRNSAPLNTIYEGFGFNPKRIYTYYPVDTRLKPKNGSALLREVQRNEFQSLIDTAMKELQSGNAQKALTSLEMALNLYPKKDLQKNDKIEVSRLYELQANILDKINKSKINTAALKLSGKAFQKHPTHECGRTYLSKAAFMAAQRLYDKNDYKKAAQIANYALRLQKNNLDALKLLQYLKEKHSELFEHLEEESLSLLHKKKEELINELLKETFCMK